MKADDRTHRLSLILISTISSPMTMLRALDKICIIITAYSYSPSRDDSGVNVMKMKLRSRRERGERKELLKTLFFGRKTGDREKKLL